jgi:DNA-binding MarR family transcriptional regulator
VPNEQDLDGISRAIGKLLRLNASRSAFSLSSDAARVPLTQVAFLVLRSISEHGSLAMGELSRLNDMDPGATARQVDKLEAAGFVRRAADRTDGRINRVSATARGKRAAARLAEVRARHFRKSFGGWSERDVRAFARLLGRFVDEMAAIDYEPLSSADHSRP